METQQETTTVIFRDDNWAKEYIKRYLEHFVFWDWKQIVIFVILSFLLVGVYSELTMTTIPTVGALFLVSVLVVNGLWGDITFKTAIIILLVFLLIGVILLIRDKFF